MRVQFSVPAFRCFFLPPFVPFFLRIIAHFPRFPQIDVFVPLCDACIDKYMFRQPCIHSTDTFALFAENAEGTLPRQKLAALRLG